MPALVGKEAIAKFVTEVVDDGFWKRPIAFDMTCEGLEVREDFATEYCQLDVRSEAGEQHHAGDQGRIVLVLHRGADGAWRIRREMWQPGEHCACTTSATSRP